MLAGLIGYPLGHSRSPAMQQAAFDALGIEARYELWETPLEELSERVAGLRAPGMLGANVTIPHKTAVMSLLDAVAPEALHHVGAVNTIVREGAADGGVRLIGYNTDFTALRRVLREQDAWAGTTGQQRRMLVLGAGGAALAALAVALLEGAEVYVAARRVEAARAVLGECWRRTHAFAQTETQAEHTRLHDGPHDVSGAPADWLGRAISLDGSSPHLRDVLSGTTVLVNATPIGTRDPLATPLPNDLLDHLPGGAFVFDMVYNPPERALVRAARARGLHASGGLAMLLYQGAEAFTLWTGRDAPLDVMRAALEHTL